MRYGQRRNGSVYVAVLGVAIILTIVGMTTVMLVRIDRRSATLNLDQTRAALLSQSAVEFAALKVSSDVSWRTTYTSGVWAPSQSLGDGSFTWMLLADSGDLTSPSDGAVKIVGRGTVSGAIQEYSAYIDSADDELAPGTWTIE